MKKYEHFYDWWDKVGMEMIPENTTQKIALEAWDTAVNGADEPLKLAPAVVGLRELKDENIKLGEKVIELSKQLGIEKSNYDELFKFFNEKYPDDMQGFFKPE